MNSIWLFIFVYRLVVDAKTREGDGAAGWKYLSLLKEFQTAAPSMARKRHLQQAQGVDGGFCFSLADTGKNQWNCDPMTNPLLSTPLHSLQGGGWWPRGEGGERRSSSTWSRGGNPLFVRFRRNKILRGCSLRHCRRRRMIQSLRHYIGGRELGHSALLLLRAHDKSLPLFLLNLC